MRNNGFFMIEFLVYLFLFSLISSFLMHFVVHATRCMRSQSTDLQRTLNFLTALDLVAHELEAADAEKKQWLKTDKSSLIWYSLPRQKDVCICVIDKKLTRIIGKYIPLQNVWSSKVTNVLTENVEDFTLDYEWDQSPHEQLSIINYSLTGFLTDKKKYRTSRSVAIKNRYLV